MAAVLSLALTLALPMPHARAEGFADEAALRAAVRDADRGRWAEAERLMARHHASLDGRVLAWMDYGRPDSTADYADIAAFIDANPDWPGLNTLRRNAEMRMPALDPQQVIAWFDAHPPLTMVGFNRYADALLSQADQSERALDIIRRRYVTGSFGVNDERDFRLKYAAYLRPQDHWNRMDRLLWDGDEDGAKRMLPIMEPGRRAVAVARMALADMAPNADALLAQVPAVLQSEPGITYERLRWRRRNNMDAAALEILQNPPADMPRPELWWTEKHIMIRRLMERGQIRDAYDLAASHGLRPGGAGFIQGEFLAGWLSLQRLAQPEVALAHFARLYDGDPSPTAQSRAGFWAGRACEKLGRAEDARRWYAAAAVHGSTFYGMMAAEAINQPESIPVAPAPSAAARAAFDRADLVRVTRLLAHALGNDDDRVGQFLRRLSQQATTPDDFVLTARLALELQQRDIGVGISRLSLQKGIVLADAGYPVLPHLPNQPEPSLVQALIRQESSFKVDAASGAGALGLMQLMPSTAQQLARRLGIKPNQGKLTRDAEYNIRLGSLYMNDLIDRFGGSYILAIAAYNAGPGRVAGWIRDYGDPRIDAVDPLDWMETIPIAETRIYVQRVLENMHVYRLRMGARVSPMSTDLKRTAAN